MEDTKLVILLKSLDKYEHNKLKKFLCSPYFNKDQQIFGLYEYLRKKLDSKSVQHANKEDAWKFMLPSKPFNDPRFRKYFSDLLKLCEYFIAVEILETNQSQKQDLLLQSLVKRDLEKHAKYQFLKLDKSQNGNQFRDNEFYYRQYLIEKYRYDFSKAELKRASIGNTEAIGENLDYFYISEKLKYYCSILSRKHFLTHEFKFQLVDEILSFLKNKNFDAVPPVKVYYQILLTFISPEETTYYYELKSVLNKYTVFFPKDEANKIYQYAQNYCITKANQGKTEFLTEYFELYQELIQKEIIIENGELNPWHFKNVILVGLRLGEYKWAEEFIAKYQTYLAKEYRKNAVTYNLAQLYFYQKDYNKVIEQLRDVEYDDLAYNLNSKMMLIAIYYETEEFDPLYSLFDSFRTYLNRHKEISPNRKSQYLKFISFTKKITNLNPNDQHAAGQIKKELEEEKAVANKKWLLEKVEELT